MIRHERKRWLCVQLRLANCLALGVTFENVRGRKAEAQRRLCELLLSVEQGTYVKPNRLTVAQFLEEWLQDYVATNTAPRTTERYQEIVKVHLIPALGSLPLLSLRPQHIQKYYAKELNLGRRDGRGGLSPLTVKKHHRVLFWGIEIRCEKWSSR